MDEEEAPAPEVPPPSDGSPAPEGEAVAGPKSGKHPEIMLPIYIMTAIFAVIFIFLPLFFRKCHNRGIIRVSIMIAAFSMWLFWITVYIAQMNPLLGPRMKNTTLAWIAHTWGNKAAISAPPASGGGEGGEQPEDSGGGGGDAEPPPPPEL